MLIRSETLELFASSLDWLADSFKVVFVDDSYTTWATDTRLSDIAAPKRQLTVAVSSGKAVTGGVLTADDPPDQTFPTSDVTIIGGWLFHDTGSAATSELLAWYDETPAGLPISFVTTAAATSLQWPTGATGPGFISL